MNAHPFSRPVLAALRDGKYLGIRAGSEHRFIGLWVVIVKDRAFVRSWNDKPGGWYRAFRQEPIGAVQLASGREVRVRARPVAGERLLDAMDAAYAEKYPTPASRAYVRGFALARRRATSLELLPSS